MRAACRRGSSATTCRRWRERAVVIDLSQTFDAVTHPAALDLLRRDVASLAAYFSRHGVTADVDRALTDLDASGRKFARQWSR